MIYTGPISEVPPLRYRMVMADPPWTFRNWSARGEGRNAKAHYACMQMDDIRELPVSHLVQRDAYLWLWATNPMLPQALGVLGAWGARFVTAGHWVKRTGSGKLAFGTGYVLRSAGEPFLIGAWGKPTPMSRSVRSVIEGQVGRHSEKPPEAFEAAGRLIEGPRIELFSRSAREGWDGWGDQAADSGGSSPEPARTKRPSRAACTQPPAP